MANVQSIQIGCADCNSQKFRVYVAIETGCIAIQCACGGRATIGRAWPTVGQGHGQNSGSDPALEGAGDVAPDVVSPPQARGAHRRAYQRELMRKRRAEGKAK
jgi:hypothetical protein